jgi:two-component system cell cycle sensor histidine kinase/response regulator CckA
MLRVLKRQLAKLGLSAAAPPSPEQWRTFLLGVQRTYADVDEDRYTLERSLMTSSREMLALNDELRQSEANFKVLVERLPDAVFVMVEERIRYANPAMAALLGLDDPASLLGTSPLETFVHSDDRAALRDLQRRLDAGEVTDSLAVRWVRRDGGVIAIRAIGTPITFNAAPAALVIARDVTEALRAEEQRAAAEQSLRLSEERYRLLFESSPLSILLFDPGTLRILAANTAAERLYGYTHDEFLSLRLVDLKVPEEVPALLRNLEAPAGHAWRGTTKHRKKDGTLIDMEYSSHAVTLDGRNARITIGLDVTQRRQLEDQLRQAQKMEAVGQLAGGVAHDFNNMLAVILSYSALISLELDGESALIADMEEITAAARRGASLTRQLLTFSRQESWQPKIVALNTLVANLQNMLSRLIGEDVDLAAVLDGRIGSILADPGQLEQVLMNLVLNARDAMPHGGKLTITTRNAVVDDSSGRALDGPPGRYVVLAVTDTGIGMDSATQSRIFEPFFTTKEIGRGTGLGLSTVFGIVKQSGGMLLVHSEVGRGTTFEAYFPSVATPADLDAPSARKPAPARGSETVLLVEDDERVRVSVRRLLSRHGYTVVEATNGRHALEVLQSHTGSIHLVLTDLVMPEMDGRTMASQMLARFPDLRVLYMSGYSEHTLMKGTPISTSDHFVQKPFSLDAMMTAVRGALGHPSRHSSLAPAPSSRA